MAIIVTETDYQGGRGTVMLFLIAKKGFQWFHLVDSVDSKMFLSDVNVWADVPMSHPEFIILVHCPGQACDPQ